MCEGGAGGVLVRIQIPTGQQHVYLSHRRLGVKTEGPQLGIQAQHPASAPHDTTDQWRDPDGDKAESRWFALLYSGSSADLGVLCPELAGCVLSQFVLISTRETIVFFLHVDIRYEHQWVLFVYDCTSACDLTKIQVL